MYSPSEGLKEINHQLSTNVAQELIRYCNALGQGESNCLWIANVCLSHNLLTHVFLSDGDMDSLLDSASVDSNESSSSQESAEERSLKNTHSPKDAHTQCSKDSLSPKEAAQSPKDTCSGRHCIFMRICSKYF